MSKSNQGNAEMMEIRVDEDALICRFGWCDDRAKSTPKMGTSIGSPSVSR